MKRSLKNIKPILPRWKQAGKDRQLKQLKLMLKTCLLLVFLFLLIGVIFEAWRGFKSSVWDGKATLYLGVQQGENLWLVKIDRFDQEVIAGKIAPNFILNISRGFGQQQAKNVYRLGELEKISGIGLVSESLALSFGLPVEGVIYLPEKEEDLKLSFILIKSLFGFGGTNLTRWDLLRLLALVNNLRHDQVESFSFINAPGVVSQKRPDGVEVFQIDPKRLDPWLTRDFASFQWVNEACSWQVSNATGHSGLASQIARILANSGIQVVSVNEAEKGQGGIYQSEEAECTAAVFFSQYLNLPLKKESLGDYRTEVRVILDEAFWNNCCSH